MIPQKVTLRNFLSFGAEQEIAFTDDEALWCIGGPNGVGKSAIFDAITYCLYGEHRGGRNGARNLIKHEEQGFTVGFEFALGDADYRISRSLGKKTTQSVEERSNDGEWKVIPNLNNGAAVDDWVEAKVGLNCDSFTASVMLCQGKASAIVEATGSERHGVLSKVIGLERFESLAKGVEGEAKEKKGKLKALKERIAGMPEVSPDRIGEAEAAQTVAETANETAETAKSAAATRVADAERWAEVRAEIAKLERELADAEARSRLADEIQKKHERLIDLERTLPDLERWLDAVDKETANAGAQAQLEPQRTGATETRILAEQRCRDANALKQSNEKLAVLEKACALADEADVLSAQLGKFPADLAEQLRAAIARRDSAAAAEREAGDARTVARTRKQQAEEAERKLAEVEIGVKCSRCGLVVDAEHAEKERRVTAALFEGCRKEFHESEVRHRGTEERLSLADTVGELLHIRAKERDRLQGLFTTNDAKLEAMGVTAALSEIRRERDETEEQRNRLKAATLREIDPERALQAAIRLCEVLDRRAAELETASAKSHAVKETLAARLDSNFHASTREEFSRLRTEAATLRIADVAGQFRDLMGDVQRRQDRLDRSSEWQAKGEAIPVPARIPIPEARRRGDEAAAVAKLAREHFDAARREYLKLQADAESHRNLQAEILAAETAERLHDKLAKLLGSGGLQRELMREAEAEIVRHADGIVGNLSNGDLSIELNRSEKKDKEALVLQVRRAESTDPIPVEYLSGSQKFRVAIALALAIGRFATGQTRPLECVIIDEGFGSLDKDGLEATAAELIRLKQFLKRIILVSHQEEFTDHFPRMIRLKPGEQGTVVEAVRGG